MTLGASLNIAKQALLNGQYSLNVISNNISNMNTPGYCRQSAAFESRAGYNTYNYASSNQFIIGEGAKLQTIMRNRDQFLDNHYRDQASTTGFYTQIGSMTSTIENTMNELGEKGLQNTLNNFFSAADKLAGDPSNEGYRIAYASALQSVADKFNQMSSTLQTAIKENVGILGDPSSFTGSKVSSTVDDLNSKLAQLADLNQQILQNSSVKGPANELMDKRDTLLDEISAIAPVDFVTNANNSVNVKFNNVTLVDGNKQYYQFQAVQGTTEDEPAIIQIADMQDPPQVLQNDVTDLIAGDGILGAILSTAGAHTVDGVNYTTVLNQLNDLANTFANKLNEIQTGINADGTPMAMDENGKLVQSVTPLFTGGTVQADGTIKYTSGNITFNQDIMEHPNLIAAGRVNDTTTAGWEDNVGNGLNMDLVLALKTEKLNIEDGTPPKSFNDYLTNMVSTIGNKLSNIDEKAQTQKDVLTQIDTQRANLYGVNLDEELTDLIKFQRAYEAASRVFNATSQMMELLTTLGA